VGKSIDGVMKMVNAIVFQNLKQILDTMRMTRQSVHLVEFSLTDVPVNVRALVPHASIFGIADDFERAKLIARTPKDILRNVKADIQLLDSLLDDWLAGPAADSDEPTDAYVAFSAMRMGIETVRASPSDK
jgi:hypothetical protein